jgi:hypothetical protein
METKEVAKQENKINEKKETGRVSFSICPECGTGTYRSWRDE